MKLEKWSQPESYAGASWNEYFVFLGQNRDSDAIDRSNFKCGLAAIGGESDTVHIVRERHWACGWIEWIAIHQDDAEALSAADNIARRLEDYPVVNEDDLSELEYDEACEFWASLSVRERADYCRDNGISIFAARRDYLPDDPNGSLFDSLRAN